MCVDDDSFPPIRPISGGAAGSRDFHLTSADGTKVMAHAARAAKPTGAGMVVIPDVRGLHPYYKELADRFAEIGVDAVAIDFFARTAPSEDRSEKFDFMSQVPLTKPETLQADIAAGVAYLRSADGGQVKSLYSMGFCFGGALSYLQAASGLNYTGVIGFYGWPLGLKRPAQADRRGRSLQVRGDVGVRRRRRGDSAGGRRRLRPGLQEGEGEARPEGVPGRAA
jgi:carboxymethylenebutenolidase